MLQRLERAQTCNEKGTVHAPFTPRHPRRNHAARAYCQDLIAMATLSRDPLSTPDDDSNGGAEPTFPPVDPVLTTDTHGRPIVLGGFSPDSMSSIEVDPSAEDLVPGDEALSDAVRRELREDAATTGLPVVVFVRRGVVHLRGLVAGPEDAECLEEVAARVPGVREVVDEIELPST
jgi:hypothetical protein